MTIDINSFDDIINNLDAKLEEIEEKKNQKEKEIFLSFINLGFKITDDVFAKGSVNKVLKIVKEGKEGKEISLKASDIEKFIYTEKELNKKKKDEKTNENENNNENKNENDKEKEDEKEKENEKENEKKNKKKKEKEKKKKNEVDEKRKLNCKTLGMETDNITNEYLEELTKSLGNYLEFQKINKKMESIENQKTKLKTRKDYNSEFINLLKLYNQLARRDYINRDDFFGIIIEEKKIDDNLKKNGKDEKSEQIDLREYIIYEINNEKDEINEIYDF